MKPAIMLAVFALATAAASAASAYHFSPPDIKAKLKGTLTFNPNEGTNTHPFTCEV